mmetsp:Transcript_30624/g.90839  ORF Transcript_30624/g.90839 Transcript_30624/m.90839 type:complete len:81 (+) Transcript_30624:207-449(+)
MRIFGMPACSNSPCACMCAKHACMVVVYVQVCASMCMLWHEWFQATRTPASHASPEEVPAGPTPHTASSRRTHIRLSHVQ